MEIASLPITSDIPRGAFFGGRYIFREKGRQRVGLHITHETVWLIHKHAHPIADFWHWEGRRLTFGMGRNMAGSTSPGTFISGGSSSLSSVVAEDGGGGTALSTLRGSGGRVAF